MLAEKTECTGACVFYDNAKMVKVKLNNIIYLTVNDHYVSVVTKYECFQIRDRLSRIDGQINKYDFVRISRSALINIKYVLSVKDDYVVMINDQKLHISRGRKTDVYNKWNECKEMQLATKSDSSRQSC